MPKGFKIHPPIAEKLGVWKYPRTLGHPVDFECSTPCQILPGFMLISVDSYVHGILKIKSTKSRCASIWDTQPSIRTSSNTKIPLNIIQIALNDISFQAKKKDERAKDKDKKVSAAAQKSSSEEEESSSSEEDEIVVKTEDLDFDLKQEPEEEKKSNQVRGHVHMTSTNLRDFWTPSVSLSPFGN